MNVTRASEWIGAWLQGALLSSGLLLGAPALAEAPAAAGAGAGRALFQSSDRCLACHNNLTTPVGDDISIGHDWRASMMANASRDPYWQASVRREVISHPALQADIEAECARCHMPMAHVETTAQGGKAAVFTALGQAGTRLTRLAHDGVACSLCHQILAAELGQPASFSGGFAVDPRQPLGSRLAFGPFEADAGRATVMRSATGQHPVKGAHIQSSELCATCHTLYTHAYDAQGKLVGELPEQVPYLEWRHSAYADAASCQDCHMPEVAGRASVTSVLPAWRENISRHVFRGGNFFIPRMLNRFRADLAVAALPQELWATERRTADHLQHSAASVAVSQVAVEGDQLRAVVTVESMAGHKLPTAFPSRRAWLQVAVRDNAGQLLFESGAPSPSGAIAGNDNDEDPRRYEPHHLTIADPSQVQIYESILVDATGRVTTGLLEAVRYIKDNRLPPAGFDKATAHTDIAVLGAALQDPDFADGQELITYLVPIGDAQGPFTVSVALWYQPISYRWAMNLDGLDAVEPRRFLAAYRAMSSAAALRLAQAERTIERLQDAEGAVEQPPGDTP